MKRLTEAELAELERWEEAARPYSIQVAPDRDEQGRHIKVYSEGRDGDYPIVRLVLAMKDRIPSLLADLREARARAEAAEKLAYIGEHYHPDLTWKARFSEERARAEGLDASLREARRPLASEEALHELCWAIVLAGQDDRGNWQPPLLGDLKRRRLAAVAIAALGKEKAAGPEGPAGSPAR
jgi:hypothetical protein